MFEYMIGEVVDKKKDYIVLLVNNIAYKVFTSKETMESDIYDGEVKIYMNLVVREDDMSLYGFVNRYEVDFFNLITTVNGVGPKTAIGILSEQKVVDLQKAIVTNDEKALMKAPGIGKKTAQRIILELKEKVSKGSEFEDIANVVSVGSNLNEAIEALTSLGYNKYEITSIAKGLDETMEVEDLIKELLKRLSK